MRIAHRIATCLAAALCLAAAPLAAKVSETVERTLRLGEHGAVVISNVNGSIGIRTADTDQVSLKAVKTASNADKLRATTIAIDESPGRIEIKTEFPKRGWFEWGNGASVSYRLTVPGGADVRATSVNGTIKIRGIRGQTDTRTVNGSVRSTDVGGSVSAETVNGSLHVGYMKVDQVGNNSLKTVNGSLQVSLPSGVNGRFRAETENGSIHTEFPLQIRKAKYGGQQSIHDQLGESGATFSFATVNGSIKILKN